jgi:hypothetical protein
MRASLSSKYNQCIYASRQINYIGAVIASAKEVSSRSDPGEAGARWVSKNITKEVWELRGRGGIRKCSIRADWKKFANGARFGVTCSSKVSKIDITSIILHQLRSKI